MAVVERDVIIVGAGPAGAICAAYLAKSGVDVLLLEKDIFPRDKVCADMVCEGIVSHLQKLEAVEELDKISTCLRNLKLVGSNDTETVMPFECYCVPRYNLDALLAKTAASWGAEVRQGCRVLDVIKERGYVRGVKVKYRGEETEIRSKLVIGADGANSAVAKELGVINEKSSSVWIGQRAYFKGVKLDKSLAQDQYNAYGVFGFDSQTAPGYFWVLPSGRNGIRSGICNVGIVINDRDSYKGDELEKRFERWISGSPKMRAMFENAERISPWSAGKLTDNTQNIQRAGNGFMLIGDAGSVMLPLFNDGLTAAADSAKAAADTAVAALRRNDCSKELMLNGYEAGIETHRSRARKAAEAESSIDEMKLIRLLMESLRYPAIMDEIINRLENDTAYRKKVIG